MSIEQIHEYVPSHYARQTMYVKSKAIEREKLMEEIELKLDQ